jgi:hypothetical protein
VLDHLPYLSYPKPVITKEHFNRWKSDPCTLELKKALVKSILVEMGNSLPDSFDKTVICAHQREGAMSMFDELMNWQPELVEEADAN